MTYDDTPHDVTSSIAANELMTEHDFFACRKRTRAVWKQTKDTICRTIAELGCVT